MIGGGRPLVPEILDQTDRIGEEFKVAAAGVGEISVCKRCGTWGAWVVAAGGMRYRGCNGASGVAVVGGIG